MLLPPGHEPSGIDILSLILGCPLTLHDDLPVDVGERRDQLLLRAARRAARARAARARAALGAARGGGARGGVLALGRLAGGYHWRGKDVGDGAMLRQTC